MIYWKRIYRKKHMICVIFMLKSAHKNSVLIYNKGWLSAVRTARLCFLGGLDMAYARARKHYRVAEKEMDMVPDGIFILDEDKTRIIIIAVIIMILVFIKGMIIGLSINQQD